MALPPPKKKSPKPPGPGGPPPGPGGPPPGLGGPPPGMDPFAPVPAGAPASPPGMDPFGGAAMPMMAPGMPKPGQGMDPMQAMLNGIGPDPMGAGAPPPQGPPLGPSGLPVGGSLPPPSDPESGDETMGGSDLLQSLLGSLTGGGDPYAVAPGQPDQGFQGMGTGDPNMGIEQLLQMLALGQLGVGGGPGAGSSGVDVGPNTMGTMVGY